MEEEEEDEGRMKEEGSDGGGGWRWALPGMTGVSAVRSERQSRIHSCRRQRGGLVKGSKTR